jgi:hypothetical protein
MTDIENSLIYPYRVCRNYTQGYLIYKVYKYNSAKHRYDLDSSFFDCFTYETRMKYETDLHEIIRLIKERLEQERIRSKPDEWVSETEIQTEFL